MKLSFSLANSKAAKPATVATPSLKRPAAFASIDDDEPVDAAFTSSSNIGAASNKKHIAQNNVELTSKAMQKKMEAEKKVDKTVYEYDEVWDKMQEAKLKQKEAKDAQSKDKKPKYIHDILISAATRRLDYVRAEEKMIQREREAEGDEFADKESFVTQAYKDQMAEVRKAEEEEKARAVAEKKKKGVSTGMAHFYKKMLEDSEQKHEATVAATQKPVIGPQPNLTITRPPDLAPKSDLELARIAREQGREVELNDDNQIVDKRELLAPGLNMAAPNTRKLGSSHMTSSSKVVEQVQTHRAAGTAASKKEINERRAREIERQLEEEQERMVTEKVRLEEEATRRIVVKRNNEEDVSSARERYIARKRRKMEEDAAAAAAMQVS